MKLTFKKTIKWAIKESSQSLQTDLHEQHDPTLTRCCLKTA